MALGDELRKVSRRWIEGRCGRSVWSQLLEVGATSRRGKERGWEARVSS